MKNRTVIILLLFAGFVGNNNARAASNEQYIQLDTALVAELARMVKMDQIAAMVPKGKYKALSNEEWDTFKDSVFRTHQKRLAAIFDKHGFPGYDLVGEDGSQHFWLMVQHSDFDPSFQQEVLNSMKQEVEKGNAKPSNFALLTDRVHLNTGKAQRYGTQVTYNTEICQAIPKQPLEDPDHVNERRAKMGLGTIEEYLNLMSKMHFEMNSESYKKKGIKQAKLYPVE